jgi:hypothetical protein
MLSATFNMAGLSRQMTGRRLLEWVMMGLPSAMSDQRSM